MQKKINVLIRCILCSILILLFDFLKFDIFIKANYSFGLLIVVGLLSYIPYLIYGTWTMWTIWYTFRKGEIKKFSTYVPLVVIVITILLLTVIPYTDAYLNLNYSFNKKNLDKTIEMVNNEEIQYRTDDNEYVVPYRLTSYTGKLYTCVNDDETKIMFYAYSGFKGGVVLIYSSDGSMVETKDFGWKFKNIKRVDDNWYSARNYY